MEESVAQNVIVFGESGVGKSSIVNLVVGSQVAKISSDATACTIRTHPYDVTIDGMRYRLWDTPGLDGGSFGRFRATIAERSLKKLVRSYLKKKKLSLLIYCVRASRATRALVRHYQFVRSVISGSENPVPMVILVTGLENSREDMENWWLKNAEDFSKNGMEFADHACITSIDDNPLDTELARTWRTHSHNIAQELIARNCVTRNQCENMARGDPGGRSGALWKYLVSTLRFNYKW